jgi:thioredoxin-related protein
LLQYVSFSFDDPARSLQTPRPVLAVLMTGTGIMPQIMFLSHRFLLALSACLFFILPAQAVLFQDSSPELAQESQKAAQEGKLLVVLFELEECDLCRCLKADVFSGHETERLFSRHFRTVSVDLDQSADITTPDGKALPRQAWASRIGVLGTSALAFFDAQEHLIYRHLGPVADGTALLLLGRYVRTNAFDDLPWTLYLQDQQKPQGGQQSGQDAAAED